MDNTQDITCLSLCSGYGGLELGLKRACPNVRTVAYVEVEAFAVANLVTKMEQGFLDVAPIWTDIKTFDGQPFRGKVHIITAGYPCQGESTAGKQLGKADPRWLWPHIERIIKTVEPIWFFGENVSNHLNVGYPTVYGSLRNLGYSVEAILVSASECLAPHQRLRLFILAYNGNGNTRKGWLCTQRGLRSIKKRSKAESAGIISGQGNSGRRKALADTTAQRIQGNEPEGITLAEGQIDEPRWPARPGQPQYEWEEPRVVDDPRSKKSKRLSSGSRQNISKIGKASKGQAQSRLGRAVDGTACRVDRLWLLGNGVVPQQAERAFRYLIRKFE